jgi:hypothetical protein
MKSYLALGLILLFIHPALAADVITVATPTPTPSPTPVLAKLIHSGNEMLIDFQDGRVAGLSQAHGQIFHSSLDMKQIENTCLPAQVMAQCEFQLDITSYSEYLKWRQHPVPAKIGQIVQGTYNFNTNQKPIPFKVEQAFAFWFDTFIIPEWKSSFRADRIVCNNLEWTQQLPMKNNNYIIASWTGEAMGFTPETEANENQAVSGAFDVELKKVDADTLEFVKMGPSRAGLIPPYTSDQVVSLTFMNGNQRQCQVTFEMSIKKLLGVISDPKFHVIDPASEAPITNPKRLEVFGFDSNLKNLFVQGLFGVIE